MSDMAIPGTSECPEFFEIAVDGDKQNTRWVFYGGNGRYLVGHIRRQDLHPGVRPARAAPRATASTPRRPTTTSRQPTAAAF